MKFLLAFGIASLFILSSCAKEEVNGFDDQIGVAADFNVDPATGDTFYRFYMPNGFTPNEDGRNDLYYVVGVGMDDDHFNMQIRDRYQGLIYVSNDPHKGWDGAVQGAGDLSQMGIYSVQITVEDTSHEQHTYIYDVMLYR